MGRAEGERGSRQHQPARRSCRLCPANRGAGGGRSGSEIHLVAHSAGSILLAHLAELLTSSASGSGVRITTCSLWAPACTIDLFRQTYLSLLRRRRIESLAIFTLSEEAERDDHCAHIYNKSLLHLVSNAFEARPRIPLVRDGVPLLGMARHLGPELRELPTESPYRLGGFAECDADGLTGRGARDSSRRFR